MDCGPHLGRGLERLEHGQEGGEIRHVGGDGHGRVGGSATVGDGTASASAIVGMGRAWCELVGLGVLGSGQGLLAQVGRFDLSALYRMKVYSFDGIS